MELDLKDSTAVAYQVQHNTQEIGSMKDTLDKRIIPKVDKLVENFDKASGALSIIKWIVGSSAIGALASLISILWLFMRIMSEIAHMKVGG